MTMGSSSDRTQCTHDADRGFIDHLDPCIIRDSENHIVWDNESYKFLTETTIPETANTNLWRQAQLVAKQGLYKVVDGETGIIVIDCLTSTECSKAALDLYCKNRGNRNVVGVIFTHSHADHFGGVKGVISRAEPSRNGSTKIPIIAPKGFLEHAVSENIFTGNAMARRAGYMYGYHLAKCPHGQISCGLGSTLSSGTITIISPNLDITHTGQVEVVDGVEMIFQITPGTEAPAEMNIFFPQFRALCMAENATKCLHNIATLRGAAVRDALAWSSYLDESIVLFAEKTDTTFASHHWPTWGNDRISKYLAEQRDLYAYLHDQTVRMINQGLNGTEIAENFVLPTKLQPVWHLQGFYGTVVHNVKAIYQRYMTWFDGNPSHLWEHPPAASAERYVSCMGGVEEAIRKSESYIREGDLRFAATLLNHVVFADPENNRGKTLLASTYESLGYGSENGPWRNFFLSGASELRGRDTPKNLLSDQSEMLKALSLHQLLSSIAVRLNGPDAQAHNFTINLYLSDLDEGCRLILSNGALIHRSGLKQKELQDTVADYSCFMTHSNLLTFLTTGTLQEVEMEKGERSCLRILSSLIEDFDEDFNIVLP
ncbi:unnamed protein product [Penicillium manginii]